MSKLKKTLKGALKSATVWVSVTFAALPELLPMVQANFADVAPFIPEALQSRTMQVVALIMLMLRLKTTASLHDKVSKAVEPPK